MPKILSFGNREKEVAKANPFKFIWEWILSLDKFTKFFLITIVLISIVTPTIVTTYLIFTSRASTTTIPGDINERKNLVDLINTYRAQNGKIALTEDQYLTNSSCWMTKDMADKIYFSHTDSLGRDPAQRMYAFGIYNVGEKKEGVAENIGGGYQTAQSVLDAWKSSPDHNSNLLANFITDNIGVQRQFSRIGIGVAYNVSNGFKRLWVMNIATAAWQSINPLSVLSSDCSFLPVNQPPVGNHDDATCTSTWGWTCDADNYATALDVHLYKDGPAGGGGTIVAMITADQTRETAVANICGGYASHGFNWPIPASLKTGTSHSIYAYAIDSAGGNNPLLGGTPKTITCPAPTPTGPPFDFSLSSSATSISISPGESGKSTITATILSGSVQPVSFSASGLPSGASINFSRGSCTPTCSSNLSINTYATVSTGTRTVTITVSGGGKTKSIPISLTVRIPTVDLIVKSSSFIPSAPVAGNLMSLTGVIQSLNSGINVMFSTRLRIDIGNNGTWDITPTNKSTGVFSSAGATEIETWTNVWTAQKGTHKFEVCTDVNNGVGEVNEANNCLVKTFTVN